MFILYGIRNVRIRTIRDEKEPCGICGDYHKEFKITQPCFHIFWIPFFPIGRKTMEGTCQGCRAKFDAYQHPALSATRTPFYMFLGLLLVVAFFAYGFTNEIQSRKNKAEYVVNPQIGDIYLMKNTEESKTLYYFTKIYEMEADTVYMEVGAYDYTRYVSRMDKEDYFVEDYYYAIHRSKLKNWFDEGIIREITRKK